MHTNTHAVSMDSIVQYAYSCNRLYLHKAGGSGRVAWALAGPLIARIIVKKEKKFKVILYADILCCFCLKCNVQYMFHANSENVPKIAYLGK